MAQGSNSFGRLLPPSHGGKRQIHSDAEVSRLTREQQRQLQEQIAADLDRQADQVRRETEQRHRDRDRRNREHLAR